MSKHLHLSLLYPGLENNPLVMFVTPPDMFPVMLARFPRLGEFGALGLGPTLLPNKWK